LSVFFRFRTSVVLHAAINLTAYECNKFHKNLRPARKNNRATTAAVQTYKNFTQRAVVQ
jgi:hypothetical protein